MYLRDARHVDKFMYTLKDETFYEPFETRYEPSHEYIDLINGLLRDVSGDWTTTRDGLWFYAHPKEFPFPVQGWKVHVSATLNNAESILERVARIALAHNIPFKFALDRNILSLFSSKRWNRGGSGKFITSYPIDLAAFQRLLEDLHADLRDEEGPYILSDKRYKDCRVLYYRYGGMKRTAQIDIMGKEILVLISPGGELIPDIRTPYFSLPSWVTDPFPDDEAEDEDTTLKSGRYLVKQALAFSNSGGVYVAEDRTTGKDVVIKEARPHTLMDSRGNNAVKLLNKERDILELLRDTNISPQPVDSFYDWENFFLVQEYLDGLDIREIMLMQSPLTKVNPSLADTSAFYEVFKNIFQSFARVVSVLHEHNIVFGDLSVNNIKIDRVTHAVRLIDFEGSFRVGVDEPTYLYTPGFRDALSLKRNSITNFEDDLYGLAAIMFYTIFPIHALSALRPELYDTVLKIVLDDMGWSKTKVFAIINGLSKNEITSDQAFELFDTEMELLPPHYSENVASDFCTKTSQELGQFLLANMHIGGTGSLFPGDPFMHRTNPVSLGFGACGVLYVLKKCGFEIPSPAYDSLEQELDKVRAEKMPPGLLTGASGIAWALSDLGLEDRATAFIEMANRSALVKRHHSYLYGMAGIGMANLHFYFRTRKPEYLATASELAESLLQTSQESDSGIYWMTDAMVHLGYGYGQSGVALFFLRLFQLTGTEEFLAQGKRALEFDLSHGVEMENGVLSFPRGPSDFTFDPYLEEGSAGIARVAIRYGIWNNMEKILSDLHRKYARYVGLLYGLGGFIDVLTDAYLFSNEAKYLEMAKRPLAGIKDLYLIKRSQGLATPGDGLLRISCDYGTGIAGILRALHRHAHLDEADFVLDEVVTTARERNEPVSVSVAHAGNAVS